MLVVSANNRWWHYSIVVGALSSWSLFQHCLLTSQCRVLQNNAMMYDTVCPTLCCSVRLFSVLLLRSFYAVWCKTRKHLQDDMSSWWWTNLLTFHLCIIWRSWRAWRFSTALTSPSLPTSLPPSLSPRWTRWVLACTCGRRQHSSLPLLRSPVHVRL